MDCDRCGKPNCCRGWWRIPRKRKSLCGACCIAAGVLVLFCFLPEWMLALGAALILIVIGVCCCSGVR